MRKYSSVFHKSRRISRIAEDLLASKELLWSMELVYFNIIYLFIYLFTAQNIVSNKRTIVKKLLEKMEW